MWKGAARALQRLLGFEEESPHPVLQRSCKGKHSDQVQVQVLQNAPPQVVNDTVTLEVISNKLAVKGNDIAEQTLLHIKCPMTENL